MRAINRGNYQLLIGDNSIELFEYFKTEELHGLSRGVAEVYPDTPDNAYIYGMANYHPKDINLTKELKPYVFFNKKRLNGTYKDVTGMMHEYLHLGRLLFNEITDVNEEQVVQFIENEINWIVENGVIGIFEQPSTKYM